MYLSCNFWKHSQLLAIGSEVLVRSQEIDCAATYDNDDPVHARREQNPSLLSTPTSELLFLVIDTLLVKYKLYCQFKNRFEKTN